MAQPKGSPDLEKCPIIQRGLAAELLNFRARESTRPNATLRKTHRMLSTAKGSEAWSGFND